VSVDAVLAVLKKNVGMAQAILRAVASRLPDPEHSPASRALERALMTAPDRIAPGAREKLAPLLQRFWSR
jgi:hypothetical protein